MEVVARRGTYRHSAYWYAYHCGWTHSEAETYTGKYLDMHMYRPKMKERPGGEWRGRDWFAWRNAEKRLDSTFDPLMLGVCIARDIGVAMRNTVRTIADPTERDRMKRELMRDLRIVRRPFYYAREKERRRMLAAERRKIRRRRTTAPMPTPEEVMAAWNARKESREAMVRLGGIHPANNIMLAGSWYWLKGGIIDGSGVAKGISIDGGRETLVADVSMKGVLVGLHIKRGANNGSSDADVRNVNIVGNNAPNSIGVLVDGYDNTLSNMRIYAVVKGVVVNSGGNCLRDLHPLVAMKRDKGFYDSTVGFEINSGHNWMDFCYSDQFCTGFKFGPRGGGVLDKCFCFWYLSKPGMRHVGFSSVGKFNAKVQSPTVVFRNNGSTNCLLEVGAPGGKGYIKDADCGNVNDPRDASATYVRD